MRAGRAGAGWCALALLLSVGCRLDLTGAACTTNDNCPVRQYCSIPLGEAQGTCRAGVRFGATLTLTTDPSILPAGGTSQAVATLSADGGPPVPDGGLVTELVTWSVGAGSEGLVSVSDDAGTRGLVQALAPGQATLVGSMVFADQRLDSTTTLVVSNAALQRIVPVADRPVYAPGTAGSAAATGFFSDGTHADLTSLVRWSSSAPAVLAVSSASGSWGQLTAIAPGQTTLKAAYLDLSGTTSVSVQAASLVALAISPLHPRSVAGSDLQLEATGKFSDGTAQPMTRSVAWSIDDATLGYFGPAGTLTVLAPGSTVVRAAAGTVQGQATLDVVPVAPVQLEISPAWPDPLQVGSSTLLSAWTTNADGTTVPASVAWSTLAPPLAVSPAGDLTAEAPGLSTVVGTAAPLDVRVVAEATADAGVSWLVWPPDAVVPVGGSGSLALERTHVDGTVQDLSAVAGWRPSDPDAGALDVDTGENGGTVRPRQAGARLGVLALLPGHPARATVRTPAGNPTLELVPPSRSLPAGARTRLSAVAHWPDGTVLDVTASASWSSPPDGVLLAGDGPGAGRVLAVDGGVSRLDAAFSGATARAGVVSEPLPGALEIWPPRASLATGTLLPLAVTLVPASGDSVDVTPDVTWTSDNPQVAIVTNAPGQAGQLQARAPGATVLTARLDGLLAGLPVTVSAATLQAVAPQVPSALVTWAPAAFAAQGRFSDGTTQDLTAWVSWSSSDPNLLRIRGTGDGRGAARGLDAGTAVVSARPRGGPPVPAQVAVNGTSPLSIQLLAPAAVALGTRPTARAIVRGQDGTMVEVTGVAEWSSTDPTVASVSSVVRPGWITTLRTGTTSLSARHAGVTASVLLQITGDTVVGLRLSAPPMLAVGDVAGATATATLSGGGTQLLGEDVVWSTDLPGVLAVSNAPGARGRLLAIAPGTALLRAQTRPGLAPAQGLVQVTVSVSGPALRGRPPFPPANGDRAPGTEPDPRPAGR